MRHLLLAAVYTLAAMTANPGSAEPFAGDMQKLAVHAAPVPLPEVGLSDLTDAPRSLAEWRGQWVVVNFWATWCAPCREEMPALDALAATGQPVVTVASGRNAVPAIERFFAEAGVAHLPALRDPTAELSRGMGILGLPVTVILNPEGQEVARLIGDADWSHADARAALAALKAR
jgi:thiol-disulfide isomerase/thioredoxin